MQNDKAQIIETLYRWISQRPGLEYGNYSNLSSYRSELRSIIKDLHHARELLRYVELRDSITAEDILDACRSAYSGRLSLVKTDKGYSVDYCTGQYWPTEYRRAACAVLASAIWDYLRKDIPADEEHKGDRIRRNARRELSRPVANRWLN